MSRRENSSATGPWTTTVIESKTRSLAETLSPVQSVIKRKTDLTENGNALKKLDTDDGHPHTYVWLNIIVILYVHTVGIYGLCTGIWKNNGVIIFLWNALLGYLSLLGVTAGAHRLWAHRSYKAKFPLRVLLMIFQTIAFQNNIYEWVRDHRVHHKFTETDADPHNAKRGFFFSHVGWLLVKKHPMVKTKGKTVDMSDLLKDPVVVFQRKYYSFLMPFLAFILPTVIIHNIWDHGLLMSWYYSLCRWVITVNGTWCVNSFAHLYGTHPYDKNINPTESPVLKYTSIGEFFHNYHHIFPYDYKAAELKSPIFNFTAELIDFFARIGWAYDLKVVPEEIIKKRVLRTGDGSHPVYHKEEAEQEHIFETEQKPIWGWGDDDLDEEEYKCVNTYAINGKMD